MISRALNALGLMRVSEHVLIVEKLEDEGFTAWNRAMTERDDMRIERDGADSRLHDAHEQITGLRADVAAAEKAADAYKHDANMWRNSLKRSGDRKKVTK